jgi:predicted metal-dependent hydrolase
MKPVAWLRQLSLFGGGSEPAPVQAPAAPSGVPVAALAPTAVHPAPTHPRANRRVVLQGLELPYELRTAQRRSIGLLVGADGLTVRAPRWVRQSDIDSLLQAKAAWILAKLKAQQSRTQQALQSRIVWEDGAELPYLGGRLCIRLRPEQAGLQLEAVSAADLADTARVHILWVGLPRSASAAQLRDIVQSWLQAQALALFEERCAHFSQRLGVRVTRLSLSSATRRWGSATAQGAVRLNWRLVHFGLPVIDYVVAHELAHLKEMNHSEAFWAVVRSVMPDYEAARQPLKDEVLPDLG